MSLFWPGSEIWTRHPDAYVPYNAAHTYESRCDQILAWFRKFKLDFATLYFDEPDASGHFYGVESVEYKNAVRNIRKSS
jgi:predicted AlkP superfamily pyrophosphatase or phosphodiesterase